MLAGKPKTRKSFLALQMAISVASGTGFFGYPVKQTSVCLFDLEGSKNRISNRTQNMSIAIPRNLYVTNAIKERLADGSLIDKISVLHQQRPDIGLFVIDTFAKSRGIPRNQGLNSYDLDVQLLQPLTEMVYREKIALMFVHHENKTKFSSDDFDSISGSTGISGSCDSILQLKSDGKRLNGCATLSCTPRDSRGTEINLQFDERCTEWQMVTRTQSKSPLLRWILQNQPEARTTGDFISYQAIHKTVYGFNAERAGDKIKAEIAQIVPELFNNYHIAVQSGVKSGGERGLRLLSVM